MAICSHVVSYRYWGRRYIICKDRVFICELIESGDTISLKGKTYSIRDDKYFSVITKETFDKYLDEARKEGARIQCSSYDYFDDGINKCGSYGEQSCVGCPGCIKNQLVYGDRTYLVRLKSHTVQCIKCGAKHDVGLFGTYETMQWARYCDDCGRIIDRKKQDEILKQIREEDELARKRELMLRTKRKDTRLVDDVIKEHIDSGVSKRKIVESLHNMFYYKCIGCPYKEDKQAWCRSGKIWMDMTDEEVDIVFNTIADALRAQESF